MNKETFKNYISKAGFSTMFIREMGWNNPDSQQPFEVEIDGQTFSLVPVAERNGLRVLQCETDEIPSASVRKKIDTRLRLRDYIAIFVKRDSQHHLWMVPVKKIEKRDLVVVEYASADASEFLFSKMGILSFGLTEQTIISDVEQRVKDAFIINSERITKSFYTAFSKQHDIFAGFISGIDDEIAAKNNHNKQWYTSVMLNRLMFCYFIQKKGFLDTNPNYLSDKLAWVKANQGNGNFFTFYKGFLCQLFHDGLNAPHHDRDFVQRYGRIPYLNGGMFDHHEIEQRYPDLDIADEAFERLFAFFDKWHWHLDDRITADGNDINPDVLGYIFEQYINNRAEMGAYYTKEDITEYIGRNTIVPFLVEKTLCLQSTSSAKDFWSFLKQSGDQYIYDAVKQGIKLPLPDYIAQGIDTTKPNLLQRRARWNESADEKYALPTEIWRETVERRLRYEEVLGRIEHGEITSVNDFITYNLDLRSFIYDYLSKTPDHQFVGNFYNQLQHITILDPTCGSGAFLFAALNILEPLYEVCISRMQGFRDDDQSLFTEELLEIEGKYRSNIQYFIFKSIILRNLYGVDIMVEATEIAKLRLFLKMVAVVEVDRRAENMGIDTLPDIDFNIRCGNTLVGYANEAELEKDIAHGNLIASAQYGEKIHTEMQQVANTFMLFRKVQLSQDEDLATFKAAKQDLKTRLAELNNTLNKHLHTSMASSMDYDQWLTSHQPFHWLAEFYEIIHGNGGFDVIIGNPPYVTFTVQSLKYKVEKYITRNTQNLFALIGERCITITHYNSTIGYIIPLSGLSIDGFNSFQNIIYQDCTTWNSFYSGDRNPSELFTGVKIRAGIYLCQRNGIQKKFVTRYLKYYANERNVLFNKIKYTLCYDTVSAPKLDGEIGKEIIEKIKRTKHPLGNEFKNETKIFYHAAPIYWCKALLNIDILIEKKLNIADSYKERTISKRYKDFTFSLLNSSLFFYYWIVLSDCYNLTKKYISEMGVPESIKEDFRMLAMQLNNDMLSKIQIAEYTYAKRGTVRFAQFFPKKSKTIIDEIDKVLAKHYGFTEEELDFIINYDIKYRMGDELGKDSE